MDNPLPNLNFDQNEAEVVNIDNVFNNPFNLDPKYEDICIEKMMDRDIFCPLVAVEPNFSLQNDYYSIQAVNPKKESFFHLIESLIFPNATLSQISVILCYIIIIVFIVSISFGQDETVKTILTVRMSILDKFGCFYPKKIKEKYWNLYRLITFNFVHYNFPHLLLNIIGLISICSFFEELVKKRCFLLIFFLNGIFTNLTGLALYEENEIFCGINIGINGIFGSFLMLYNLNCEELRLILGPLGFCLTPFILGLFEFMFTLFFLFRQILQFSIAIISIIYGALLCAIIVKPIKNENWKLYTRIGSGVIIFGFTSVSLVRFILKD